MTSKQEIILGLVIVGFAVFGIVPLVAFLGWMLIINIARLNLN